MFPQDHMARNSEDLNPALPGSTRASPGGIPSGISPLFGSALRQGFLSAHRVVSLGAINNLLCER